MSDIDKTMAPRRGPAGSGADDVTMPGKRDRKPDGRFAVGDLIMERYKVLAELGQGGMGVVYKCFDEDAGIEVALKALPPELSHNTLEMEDIKENFQLVHNLHHPNIASSNTLEKDKSNGNYYLIMECCEGEDLRHWLRRKRKEGELKLEDVLPIIKQVAEALDYAHEMKIIHRDIKPGNIMIDNFGKIKVLDFGLAAQIHTSMTRVSMAYHGTSGTGPYMAPEQWEGRIQDAKADQYALAVMTYEMLAGHTPFESTDAAVLREAVLKSKVIPLENIPPSANAAVMRALSKESSERFENCSDFAAALDGKKIKAGKTVKKGRFSKWIAAIILLALLGGGGTGYYLFDKQQKEVQRIAAEKEKERLAKLAKEKAEKERLAKLAEEKAEKERQAKLAEEKRKNELIQENYRLQPHIKKVKSDIESAGYDRGQTFGKYLDILTNDFASAERAELNSDPVAANRFYKSAEKAAEWLITNAPLRIEIQKLQKQVAAQKSEADRINACEFANSLYQTANLHVANAEKDYEAGNFSSAMANLKSAVACYSSAYENSHKKIIENLLNSIELAQKTKKWDELKKLAEKLRSFDANKAENYISFADKQVKLEKIAVLLVKANKAQIANNWEEVYNYAMEALKIDNTDPTVNMLRQKSIDKNFEKYYQLSDKRGIHIIKRPDAKKWILIAAESGNVMAQYYWGLYHKLCYDHSQAIKWLHKAAEQGCAEAMLILGGIYYEGGEVKKDLVEADKWFQKALKKYKAAENKLSARDHHNIGMFYFKYDLHKNIDKSIYHLRQAAEQGMVAAQASLGSHYFQKLNHNHHDQVEAIKWLRAAAEQGHATAKNDLAFCNLKGFGVVKNHKRAAELFLEAAEDGEITAQLNMGNCYLNGWGVEKSKDKAQKWFEKYLQPIREAAERGFPRAQYNLGLCYLNGQIVDKDYGEAVHWLRKASEQDFPHAYGSLGGCYMYGYGVDKDPFEGVNLTRKAADQGVVFAQNSLGFCYLHGIGVTKNFASALRWFRKAAEQNDANALNNIGFCYLNGLGVEKNIDLAAVWLRKAAKQGSKAAENTLKKIGR